MAAALTVMLLSALFGTGWLPGPIAARLSDLGSYVAGPDPTRTEITDANFAVLERLAHWQAGLRMFDANPWLGVGIGNYAAVYAAYALPRWYEALGHAHNVYINSLAETGVLGAAAFAIFWVAALLFTGRAVTRRTGYSAALARGVLGSLVYVSIHSVFDNLFVQHMQLQLALLLAAVVVTGSEKHARSNLAT